MKKIIVSAVVAASLFAGAASAQSYYPTYTSIGSTYSSVTPCLSITSNLSVGSRGSQVLALQQFLVSQNYPGSGSWMETSYFGAATRAALVDFQQSQGLQQTGYVDASTLATLERCGGTSYTYPGYPGYNGSYPYTYTNNYSYPYTYGYGTPTITSLSQNTGNPGNTVTIYGQGFDPANNTVYFGGQAVSGVSSNSGTSISFTIPYTYSYSNNQTVQLYVTDSRGTSNSVTFTLNPLISNCNSYPYSYNNCGCSNTYAYSSSCSTCGYVYQSYPYSYGCSSGNTGTPVITYLNPQSGSVGASVTIYGSGFTTSNNTVRFGNGIVTSLGSSDGQSLSFVVPSQITGYGSQPITLGTYQVSVTNGNGANSNSMPFVVTSTGSGNGAPSITNVTGPSTLQAGVSGTWQVAVNTFNSSYTSLSVSWGDTGNGFVNQAAPQTLYGNATASFSHAYANPGTYTITFNAANQYGQSTSYSTSVIVTGSSIGTGPAVSYLSPTSGYVGTQVTIYGSNFATNGQANTVNFGSGAITNVYSNGNTITFTVPSSIAPYCTPGLYCAQYIQQVTPGTYNVSVMDPWGTSNTVQFTVL